MWWWKLLRIRPSCPSLSLSLSFSLLTNRHTMLSVWWQIKLEDRELTDTETKFRARANLFMWSSSTHQKTNSQPQITLIRAAACVAHSFFSPQQRCLSFAHCWTFSLFWANIWVRVREREREREFLTKQITTPAVVHLVIESKRFHPVFFFRFSLFLSASHSIPHFI